MNPEAPKNPGQAAVVEGFALINKGYTEQGEAKFTEAERLGHPFAARYIVETRLANKVASLAQAGQRSLALACLDEAPQLNPAPSAHMIDQLRKLVEPFREGQFIQPKDARGWNHMGTTLSEAGKNREAVHCFWNAVELDPHSEIPWLNLGLALGKLKEYLQALVVLDRLLAIKPESINGWGLKGMVLGNLQKNEEAIVCYNRVLELDPRQAQAWYNKSLALSNLKEYADALKCCDKALELNLHDLNVWLTKARALFNLGRYEEALDCGRVMSQIDPVAASALFNAEAAKFAPPES